MMRSEYLVLQEFDYGVLAEAVNGKCQEGWHPLGGIAVVAKPGEYGHYLEFYQAMTKNTEELVVEAVQPDPVFVDYERIAQNMVRAFAELGGIKS